MMQSPGTFYLRRKHPDKHELQIHQPGSTLLCEGGAWERVLTEDIGFSELNEKCSNGFMRTLMAEGRHLGLRCHFKPRFLVSGSRIILFL